MLLRNAPEAFRRLRRIVKKTPEPSGALRSTFIYNMWNCNPPGFYQCPVATFYLYVYYDFVRVMNVRSYYNQYIMPARMNLISELFGNCRLQLHSNLFKRDVGDFIFRYEISTFFVWITHFIKGEVFYGSE